jgi:uncharacterized membrane protein
MSRCPSCESQDVQSIESEVTNINVGSSTPFFSGLGCILYPLGGIIGLAILGGLVGGAFTFGGLVVTLLFLAGVIYLIHKSLTRSSHTCQKVIRFACRSCGHEFGQ